MNIKERTFKIILDRTFLNVLNLSQKGGLKKITWTSRLLEISITRYSEPVTPHLRNQILVKGR